MPATLLTALSEARDDAAPLVTVGDDTLTREELVGAAAAVADRISGAERVAIDARADVKTVVAVVGCLLAGVAAVPVPPDSGGRELQHILADSGAELWLGDPRPGLPIPSVPIDPSRRSATVRPEPPADAPALIVYTSGTTGAPKGVVLPRRAIAASVDGLARAWDWTPGDRLVHGLPLFHVHGLVLGVLGALRIGSPLVHTVRPTPDRYAAAQGTLYFGVPTVWSRVCAEPAAARALSSARLLVSGSAPLPVPVFEDLVALTGSAPIERYGMSETVITISTRVDGERRPGWVGLPLDGVRTRLRTESGELAPHDGETLGQLEIAGPTLFSGYLNNPVKTAETMTPDGWFRTGDIAVVDRGGFHRIVGRESVDMIKSGGYRIGAGEVEHALLAHPGVREAAVVGEPDADLGQRIVAYVVGDNPDTTAIIDFVAASLSVHKRPREVRVVDSLPRNEMGKVQKKALLAD
ncbi:acyl-CoA synthetase [Rhodococcus zopfii]|uniref:Acyl-CoA synthetase n=1 Tax=Rhodococcus zopfii TaxID=43772 RepID=A0ABU3WRU8_9NOCA|nr:acyl-CoA synthetase [Rhodococcus zopfii]MDV2476732.1 acyl-CoA synthetase [Rhodococcus zopfii]